MANIKYIGARRHQVGWYDELPDPYEDPYYNSHLSSDIGNNSYWNFLGKDGSKIYETWFRFSFADEDMITPQQVGSISFQLAFRFHKDRVSSKSNVPIRCYIFPKDLNDAYKLRDSIQMEKDEENLVTYTEQNVTFDSTFRDYTFDFTIDKPQSNEFLAVLKIHPDYEINGWCPVEWHHKLPLGGDIDSSQRTWKSTEIKLANYTITIIDGDTTSQEIEAIYDSELKGSYINIQAPQKDYYTFLGWSTTRDTKKPEFLYDETKTDYQIGPFSKDTTLYEIYEKDHGILTFTDLNQDNCEEIIISEEDLKKEIEIIKGTEAYQVKYKTGDYKFTLTPQMKIGWEKLNSKEFKANKKEETSIEFGASKKSYTITYKDNNGNTIYKKTLEYNANQDFLKVKEKEIIIIIYNQFENNSEKLFFNVTTGIIKISDDLQEFNWDEIKSDKDTYTCESTNGAIINQFTISSWQLKEQTSLAFIDVEETNSSLGQSLKISVDNTELSGEEFTNKEEPKGMDFSIPLENICPVKLAYTITFDGVAATKNIGENELSFEEGTIPPDNKYWTLHEDSPFAEFYINLKEQNPSFPLNQNLALYSVSDKKLWIEKGIKYFDPKTQAWSTIKNEGDDK